MQACIVPLNLGQVFAPRFLSSPFFPSFPPFPFLSENVVMGSGGTLQLRVRSYPGAPEAFQDCYGENHPISRSDDGGTEGPERGAGGAKRRSAEGVRSGEGRRSPSPVWGSGAMPPENF